MSCAVCSIAVMTIHVGTLIQICHMIQAIDARHVLSTNTAFTWLNAAAFIALDQK